ncbi:hypothetical protein BU23DRAFT_513967 [Bimuria novae-zelandiae CBS 107.79]|uniref:Uncharacterized protein n=1 Tax=Bimuria novae-zelandiae CBS 107.79 TaxID=1447943 RepID=A0A6A5UVT5_9PLEO|nr:hypothetical protein BU23DRAFT_513967 [Bimuria novae-zelandiae CBS 107.79]
MALNQLNSRVLRSSKVRDVTKYLRGIQQSCVEDDITRELIHLIEIDSIAPAAFGQWLGITRSSHTVRTALAQNVSNEVRRLAIKKLGKLLSSLAWSETWDALGGTPGLLEVLSDLSVQDVKQACRVFVRSVKNSARQADVETKRDKLTELFKALLPRLFLDDASTVAANNDHRQLRAIYQRLVPACTSEVVSTLACDPSVEVNNHLLLLSHAGTLKDLALQYVFDNHPPGERWLTPLLSRYPPTTTDIPGISAPMQFSLDVLRRLTKQDAKTPLLSKYVMVEIAVPLLRKALRKKVDWSVAQEIVNLTMAYLESHPDTISELNLQRGQFVHLTGVCWSRNPEPFADQFAKLLALLVVKIQRKQFFNTMDRSGLLRVQKSRRYALMLFYYNGFYSSDLGGESDIRGAELPLLTRSVLDTLLLPEDALALFTLMRSAKGDENLIDRNIYSHADTGAIEPVDVDMWHAVLLFRCGHQVQAEEVARKGFQARKKAAISSAGQEQRARNTRFAIDFATASGSFDLLMEAHEWARRFVRDPLTARELYQVTMKEGVDLLSGVSGPLQEHLSYPELRDRIIHANRIILFIFETTCLALREASFNRHHFRGVLDLFADVVRERVSQCRQIKKIANIDDEQLYHALWEDTLDMLIMVEEKGLSPGYENLSLHTVRGALNSHGSALENAEPTTLRFFDDLAKRRDKLWQKHRVSMHSAVAALPEPFPRGLPIQHLIGLYSICVHNSHPYTPYIAARMEATLFPDPKAALTPVSEDPEMREAIGPFVDDYFFALRMMVPKSLNEEEKKSRIHRVWSYATGPLSKDRFTEDEAVRYWKREGSSDPFLKLWPSDETVMSRYPDWPLVPDVEHAGEVEEWDPAPEAICNVSERKLETTTYIDISKGLKGSSYSTTIGIPLRLPAPVIPPVRHAKVFSVERIHQARAKPAIREGQILSALLQIENRIPKSGTLKKAFPSTDRSVLVRYPACYLNGQFLSENSRAGNRGADLACLEANLKDVPPSLLAQFARNAYSALTASSEKDEGYLVLENLTLRLAIMLTRCDRPTLASELIVRMVLDRPHNSSWHRQLLSSPFFRRLPASAAQDCMSVFAQAIIIRTEDQSMTRATSDSGAVPETVAEVQPRQKAYVKITTVKLLAQLLGDTQCISEDFAISLLSQLMTKASHIDIRSAVMGSLLGMLKSASPKKCGKILATLESVIPMAGNLRERRPITDEQWTHAEDELELPELDAVGSPEDTAPMLLSLFSFTKSNPSAAFVSRIIIPIITSLKHQTAKWSALFLRKHGFDFAAQQELALPPLPREQQIMYEVLRCAAHYLPLSFLEDFTAYHTFNIVPPAAISALNKRLEDDVASKSKPDVKSWLARYTLGLNVSTYTFNITSLLDTDLHDATSPSATDKITPKAVQEAYLKLYTLTLHHDTETLSHLHSAQRVLWPYSPSSPISKSWADRYKPLVEAIILYVEGLRTREWDRDPNRRPAVLPNTFALRMHLLQFASRYSEHSPHSEEHCAAFAARVAKIADQIAGGLYHAKFLELKNSLKYVRGEDRLRVACHLGDVSKTRLSWLSLQDCLRVELAASLLYEDVREKREDELAERVEALRASWRASENEEVRRWASSYGVGWRA